MLLKWVALTNSVIALAQTEEIEKAIQINIGEADHELPIVLDNLDFIAKELIQRSDQDKTDIRTNVINAIAIQVSLAVTLIDGVFTSSSNHRSVFTPSKVKRNELV